MYYNSSVRRRLGERSCASLRCHFWTAVANYATRDPRHQRAWWNAIRYNGAGSDHGASSNPDAVQDFGPRANPAVVSNVNTNGCDTLLPYGTVEVVEAVVLGM